MTQRPASDFETIIDYQFKDKALLDMALTHPSADTVISYERMEFLGDRVLGLIVADHIYHRFPKEPEGPLAKRLAALVQGSMLAEVARDIDLGDFIYFSEAEKLAGGAENDNILSDVLESVIGAIYLDAGREDGLEKCRTLIETHFRDRFDKMITPPQHPKTKVQEWAQSQNLPLPLYDILEQTGPDHAPEFLISVTIQGHAPVQASGSSRQTAEKAAATAFIEKHKL